MARDLHRSWWIIAFTEATLSHLTVTYAPSPPVSSPVAAPASGDATAPDNPLGFLAALIDQLVGKTPTTTAGTAETPTDTAAAPATPTLPSYPAATFLAAVTDAPIAVNEAPVVAAADTPEKPVAPGTQLLARLSRQLDRLERHVDEGVPPSDREIKAVTDTAEALIALLSQPAPGAQGPVVDDGAPDETEAVAAPVLHINGRSGFQPSSALPAFAGSPADVAAWRDVAARLPAALGVAVPQTEAAASSSDMAPPATDSTATPTQNIPPAAPALAALVARLTEATRSVAPLAPEAAAKLAELGKALKATASDPNRIASLTTPDDSDGTELADTIRQLLGERPAPQAPTTPKLATTTSLALPQPLVAPKSAPEAQAAPATPTPAAPTPTPAASAHAPVLSVATTERRAEAPASLDRLSLAERAPVADAATTDTTNPAPTTAAATAPAATDAAPARALPAAYQAAATPINMGQVAFELSRQLHQGQTRFNIRLDPPELGRIDVKMHVDAAGTVNARLTVERAETLDLFQRDRAALERALGQAGLDSGKTNLEFSLRQNPFAGMAGGEQHSSGGNAAPRYADGASGEAGEDAATPVLTLYRGTASAGGVNLIA